MGLFFGISTCMNPTNTCGNLVSMCERTTFQILSRHPNVDEVACTYRNQNYSRDNMLGWCIEGFGALQDYIYTFHPN